VIVALVAAGLMVTTTNGPEQDASTTVPDVASLTSAPTTEAGVARMASASAITAMVDSVRQSTVALTITSSDGTTFATGLVVESGGIVVTTAKGVQGAKSITVTEADGTRQTAAWVDTDPSSNLSVLHIADQLPVATFDDADPPTGSTAVAMAVSVRRRAVAPTPIIYAGTVRSTGEALGLDSLTSDFAVTAIAAPLSADDVGCPLIGRGGQVVGMLDEVATSGTSSLSIFLPAALIDGVAAQLVNLGGVDRGSIGASVQTQPGTAAAPAGAELDSVDPTGPAAAEGMQTGDVITSVDDAPVRSAAELDNWLYADPPGSTLNVTFDRGGESIVRSVQVVDPEADAPGSVSSP
jgi:putative serine protease PepD